MSWTSCHVPDASPPHSHSTSNSLRGISPPSPTLLAGSARLNADSSAFVPRPRSRIVVKNTDGLEVDLSAIAKSSPISVAGASLDPASGFRQGSLSAVATPSQRPLSIKIETEKQRRKRLADQKKKFKAKSRAEEEEKERQQEQEQKRNEECKAREEQGTSRIIISPLLDITSNTKKAPPSFPSACATARVIDDLGSVPYPEGISSPKVELNINAKNGKFRYDSEFLLQFMSICKDKPDMLYPLDVLGLDPSSDEPSDLPISGRAPSVSDTNVPFGLPSPWQKTASQGGRGGASVSKRIRSKRGKKRNDSNQVGSHGFSHGESNMGQSVSLESVAPPQATVNRWDASAVDPASPEMVIRKVRGLLNKLTMEKFDSISDKIIALVNESEKENNGKTLIQVTQLVYERATDDAEMYALLCRKIMEQISPSVQDHDHRDVQGKPIAGGQLFRKCLLNRCWDDFERGCVEREETVAAAAATKALENQVAAKAANDMIEDGPGGSEEIVRHSDETTAAQKAKRWQGLMVFYGELFKFQMLTERIMHDSVKRLLGNVETPEQGDLEGLCTLLMSVGAILDTPKARAHMDVYFSRMKELAKSQNTSPRMQFMLQDVIELRERKWVSRNNVTVATTIAQIHEAAAKEKAALDKQSYQRQVSTSRSGFLRGGDRGDHAPIVFAGVADNGLPKPGDLSKSGQSRKSGPGSVLGKKGKKERKRESKFMLEHVSDDKSEY